MYVLEYIILHMLDTIIFLYNVSEQDNSKKSVSKQLPFEIVDLRRE